MTTNFIVTKASGDKANFSEEKLHHSLKQSGATTEQIDYILSEVYAKLYQGISTKKIYQIAFGLLRDTSRHLAARYHLKKAIMSLGPSGYPFEKFVAEILNYQGYKTTVGVTTQGLCVSHEIDVIAEKGNNYIMVECKYHNQSGVFCDVKIPLYIQSRFLDVIGQWKKQPELANKLYAGWVATNTRFSEDAMKYGTCAGLHLLGWDYPIKNGLKDLIDTYGLYPITCLTSLTKPEKKQLLDKTIVLCKDLNDNHNLLDNLGIKPFRIKAILQECAQLCEHLALRK
ncbi:MAG: restriction endonuclease [Bacteroidetes bacterium]|nr:restriction endonuclease [Bacteroidota bacterium]